MKPNLCRCRQAIPRTGLAAFALLFLAGCQGHKVVARVNNVAITEDEFTERALRVKGANLVNQGQLNIPANMEIGGKVLIDMIREELTRQLAAEKKFVITPETLHGMVEYLRRDARNPQQAAQISSLSDEELERLLRLNFEELAIGTNGAQVDDKEVAKRYEANKDKYKLPAKLSFRSIPFSTEDAAKQALGLLNSGTSFSAVAQQLLHITSAQADANFGRENVLSADYLHANFPALHDALSTLGPNKFVPQPIAIRNQNGMAAQTVYVVAQLVKKEPEYIPPLQQIRPFLEKDILMETRPDLQAHAASELAKYTQEMAQGKIQINIERYKDLVRTYIVPQALAHAIGSSGAAPGGPGAGGAGAGSPPPGSGAAPSGSEGAAPNGAAPSGSAPSSGAGSGAQPGSGKP